MSEFPQGALTRLVLFSAPLLKNEHRAKAMRKALEAGMVAKRLLDHMGLRGDEAEILWLTSEQENGKTMPDYVAQSMGLLSERRSGSLVVQSSADFDDIAEGELGMRVMERVAAALSDRINWLPPVVEAGPHKLLFLFAPSEIVSDVIQVALDGWLPGERWVIEESFTGQSVTVLCALT